MTVAPVLPVNVTQNAQQFWPGLPGPDLFMFNSSVADTITIGPKGIQPYGPNGYPIGPLGSITLPSEQPWSAVTDATDQPVLTVLPGGGNQAVSPVAMALAISESALPLLIAQQIAANGISLIGAPVLLLNIAQGGGPNAANLVGATIDPSAYGMSNNVPANWVTAAKQFDGYVGAPMALQCRKWYAKGSTVTASDMANIQALSAQGCQFLISLRPQVDPTGQYIADPYINEHGNVANTCAALTTAGVSYKICFWQEPNLPVNGFTAAAFIALHQFYISAVPGGIKRCYNPSVNHTTYPTATTFYPGDTYVDEIYADYYGGAWADNVFLDDAGGLETFANAHNKPFGIGEWGPLAQQAPFNAVNWEGYVNYLITLMSGRINASQQNGWIMYYGTQPPVNIVTSSNSPMVKDPQGMDLPAVYASLASQNVVQTIAANATYTVPPITASPFGKFAFANQISYEITLNLVAGVSSTNPFCNVVFNWYNTDTPNAPPVDTEIWSCPMGANGTTGTIITGRGPMIGQFLQVKVHNVDTVTCDMSIQVNGTGRSVNRHDWRWDPFTSVAVPGFNLPTQGGSYGNSLLSGSISLNAGQNHSWLAGMYSGQVFVRANCTQTAQIVVTPVPSSRWGTGATLSEDFGGANPEFTGYISIGRAPTQVEVINNGSATATINCELVINNDA